MILVEYHNEKVTSDAYLGEAIISAIQKVAQKHPLEQIVISKKGLNITEFLKAIKDLSNSYSIISSSNFNCKDLCYVEDGPFLNISGTNTYPTWVKSGDMICLPAALVNQIGKSIPNNTSLFYWINSVAKITRPQGILNYQVPTKPSSQSFSDVELYQFVKQHYKPIWTLLLLLCHIKYEKRFPIYAFAKAQFFKRRKFHINADVLQKIPAISISDSLNYDVVIPTIGRKEYLKEVLEDLNQQEIKPHSVIIIEQNPVESSISSLDYLSNGSWNFKIEHRFKHVTGACRARNEAISITTAPWVLLFDDDVRIEKEFSSQVKEFLNQTNAKCVTFACLQKGEIESMNAFKQWESFGSGCSIVHREVIEKCKFDMALEHGYGEDVDYGMQIRKAGYDVIYAPQIQILHLKAPVGGFRKPHVFPWQNEEIQPKPSPQIMYHRKKNYTQQQLLGYKMVQFFKTYGVFGTKNPWKHYSRYRAAWNASEKWASQL